MAPEQLEEALAPGDVRIAELLRQVRPLDAPTRKNAACSDMGRSPISSRNSVPPAALRMSPGRSAVAPVNAPLRCPNSSLSTSVSGSAPQLAGSIPAVLAVPSAAERVQTGDRLRVDGGAGTVELVP